MFEPENDLERNLVRAVAEPARWPDFLRAMFNGTTFVALGFDGAPPTPNAQGKLVFPEGTKLMLRTVRSGDQDYLPFFTAPARARATFKGKHVVAPGMTRELFERHPGKQFILNPGHEHTRAFSSEDVNHLLAGQFAVVSPPVSVLASAPALTGLVAAVPAPVANPTVSMPPVAEPPPGAKPAGTASPAAKSAAIEPPAVAKPLVVETPVIKPMVLETPITTRPVFPEEAFVFKPMAPAPPPAKPAVAEAPAAAKPDAAKPIAAAKDPAVDVTPANTPVADNKPAVIEAQVFGQPATLKPVEARPVEAKPVEAKPVEATLVDTKPVEPKPAPTEKPAAFRAAAAEALAAIKRYAAKRSSPEKPKPVEAAAAVRPVAKIADDKGKPAAKEPAPAAKTEAVPALAAKPATAAPLVTKEDRFLPEFEFTPKPAAAKPAPARPPLADEDPFLPDFEPAPKPAVPPPNVAKAPVASPPATRPAPIAPPAATKPEPVPAPVASGTNPAPTPAAAKPALPRPPAATIGRPDPYPVDVLFGLTWIFQGEPAVEEAHLAQAQLPGRKPHLLVALGSTESFEPLMQIIGPKVRKAFPDQAIEFTPLTGGAFEDYFRTETQPFFKKRQPTTQRT
jgi:hypothetical protein